MRALLLVVALSSGACLRTTQFHCTTNADCSTTGAVCESNGYCSFIDTGCADGRRYGDLSGPVAGQCVGMEGADAGVDAPIDAPGKCPSTYMALGASAHRYRVIASSGTWDMQRAACNADGTAAYLAVPNDQTELTALTGATTAALFWLGIDDRMTEGTYVTQRAGTIPANDPMWDSTAGEPNNQSSGGSTGGTGADCVTGKANAKLADDACISGGNNKMFPAICECEP